MAMQEWPCWADPGSRKGDGDKMKKIYYAAVGNNGGIVTDDYENALVCKRYLRGHVYTKKFFDFDEAEEYLLDHISEMAPIGCPIPEH